MDAPDVWVASEDGKEIVRVRDISAFGVDCDGNVTVRLAGHDGTVITLVGRRTHRDEHKPGDLHRQLLRVAAQLSESSEASIVRPTHEEARGWVWVSEPL